MIYINDQIESLGRRNFFKTVEEILFGATAATYVSCWSGDVPRDVCAYKLHNQEWRGKGVVGVNYIVVDFSDTERAFQLVTITEMKQISIEQSDLYSDGKKIEKPQSVYAGLIQKYSSSDVLTGQHYLGMFAQLTMEANDSQPSVGSKVYIPFKVISNPQALSIEDLLRAHPEIPGKFHPKR